MTQTNTTAADDALVLREDRDGIAYLTLNRPNQFNALSEELLDALQANLDAIAEDKSVRVVVLAGNGRAFCAGHDLKQMRTQNERAYFQQLFTRCGQVMTRISSLPQPVIARVHGIATAAGCQLVASCDLAIAEEGSRFAVSGINVGLFCGTPSVPLSRNVGRKQAMEMLLTGGFIPAQQAAAQGLVNRAVPLEQLDDEVLKLARTICDKSSASVALGKAMYYKQLEMGVEQAYQFASEAMADNMMFEDVGEGIDAFTEKRPPNWRDR
ncbi:enoyl-CoA hydratase [Sedimenticola selenatireducens]|uniref:enoyl-CoA hydratase n=1 Tax=Sedimenticola selenatireducens TaxID=191960 RepID=UPI003F4A9C04